MKKLYVSCPMRNRTDEEIIKSIDRMEKVAEIMVGEELDLIPTLVSDADHRDEPIYMLGSAIKRMQDADYVAVPDNSWEWRGCDIESGVARLYLDPEQVLIIPNRAVFSSHEEYLRSAGRDKHLTACEPVNG